MICNLCGSPVDTDEDFDSLYTNGVDCVCKHCRDRYDIATEFDEDYVIGRAGG